MNQTAATPDISALSFEDAVKELENIVRKLESGQAPLEQAIADYARGTSLKEHCEKKLGDAKLKVDMIVKGEGGALKAEPFPVD